MIPVAYPLLVTAPVIGLAAFCLAHIACSRLMGSRRPYFPVVAGCCTGLIVLTGMSAWLLHRLGVDRGDALALLTLNVLTYVGLAYGYFAFVNLNLTSLRIRMLSELLDHDGELATAVLLNGYSADHVAQIRLERLVAGGHFVGRHDRFQRGPKSGFFVLAGTIARLRAFIIVPDRQSGPPQPDLVTPVRRPD
jgi:hypothetical protein